MASMSGRDVGRLQEEDDFGDFIFYGLDKQPKLGNARTPSQRSFPRCGKPNRAVHSLGLPETSSK